MSSLIKSIDGTATPSQGKETCERRAVLLTASDSTVVNQLSGDTRDRCRQKRRDEEAHLYSNRHSCLLLARGWHFCLLKESRCDERRHECSQDPLQRGTNMRRGWRKNEIRARACAKEEGVCPRKTVPRKTGETLEVMLWLGSPLSISLGSSEMQDISSRCPTTGA